MKQFQATTQINATPEKVWAVLMDTARYPEWDPHCDKIEGRPALGAKIKAYTKLSPGRAFAVKVTVLTPNALMVWSGGLPLGLFKGERTFRLVQEAGGVQLTVSEVFSGLLLPLFARSLPDMTKSFQDFVDGLKAVAERA